MQQLPQPVPQQLQELEVYGHCTHCAGPHRLRSDLAVSSCRKVMEWLETSKRLDYLSPHLSSATLATESLFGPSRGKMFGVLTGTNNSGCQIEIYAFSGQYNGHWLIPGWAPPLFDVEKWQAINTPMEKKIKKLGHILKKYCKDDPAYKSLHEERRYLSRNLMKDLHNLYIIPNFRGKTSALSAFFHNGKIPTGTGDCCAPKLLGYAANNHIKPIAMAEFYWGEANRSKTREHRRFYPPCQEKCHPLLGHMLCGL